MFGRTSCSGGKLSVFAGRLVSWAELLAAGQVLMAATWWCRSRNVMLLLPFTLSLRWWEDARDSRGARRPMKYFATWAVCLEGFYTAGPSFTFGGTGWLWTCQAQDFRILVGTRRVYCGCGGEFNEEV